VSTELENDLMFVSIAAYRDTQLIATVADCLSKADNPYNESCRVSFSNAVSSNHSVSIPPMRYSAALSRV